MRKAAYRLLRAAVRASEASAALASYLAAGTLRRADLKLAIRDEWERFGTCNGPSIDTLLPWESAFYDAHLRGGERLLLVGCGAGRDLIPLLERGHRVTGLDVAPGALAQCRLALRERGLAAELIEGSAEDATLPPEHDVAIFSWYCYGYLPGRDARVRALRNVAAALARSGRILLSYVPRSGPVRLLPIACARAMAWFTRADWRPEPGDSFLLANVGSGGTLHYEHRFAPDELVAESGSAGLRVLWHEVADEGRAVLAQADGHPAA